MLCYGFPQGAAVHFFASADPKLLQKGTFNGSSVFFLYAMRGFDGHVRQNTTERSTPSENQWSLIAPMHQERSDASGAALDGTSR